MEAFRDSKTSTATTATTATTLTAAALTTQQQQQMQLAPILDLTSTNDVDDDLHEESNEGRAENLVIAETESRAVRQSKWVVYLVVLACAVSTSVVTWAFVRREETQTFRDEFRQFADAVLEGADSSVSTIFDQLQTLSTSITSHALLLRQQQQAKYNGTDDDEATTATTTTGTVNRETEWYFSLPHVDTRMAELQSLAGSELILWAPLIQRVPEWENFTQTRRDEILLHSFGATDVDPSQESTPPASPVVFPVPPASRVPNYDRRTTAQVAPVLQYGPLTYRNNALLNLDLYSHTVLRQAIDTVVATQHSVLVDIADVAFLVPEGLTNPVLEDQYLRNNGTSPQSIIVEPIFDQFLLDDDDDDEQPSSLPAGKAPRRVSGVLVAMEPWSAYFERQLPDGLDGFLVDLQSTCRGNSDRTFRINGKEVVFEGHGDLHDPEYDSLGRQEPFATFARADVDTDDLNARERLLCDYSIVVYPAHAFEDTYHTGEPFWYAALVLVIFLVTLAAFAVYDVMVQRRQRKVLRKAQDSTQLVQSLFPKEVGQRLMEDAEQKRKDRELENRRMNHQAIRCGINAFRINKKSTIVPHDTDGENQSLSVPGENETMSDTSVVGTSTVTIRKGDPIAEYYPESTIMFADMVGFTSWSSVREPKTVFTLLETLYGEFDARAKHRRVFKIETIGDCYVAVAGVPQPHPQHFLAMARFARDCLLAFSVIIKNLESQLGKDTSDLALRIGLHSGPVTGGVLRNDRARFQLFGDTMNVASRMESTGHANRIHISLETAELLRSAGKSHWLRPREEMVFAKGKGTLQTYWIVGVEEATSTSSGGGASVAMAQMEDSFRHDDTVVKFEQPPEQAPGKSTMYDIPKPVMRRNSTLGRDERLASWNVDILGGLLQEIVVGRMRAQVVADSTDRLLALEEQLLNQRSIPFDELEECISFIPNYTSEADDDSDDENLSGKLDPVVARQLKEYIHAILSTYRDNDFHSFEHASHVTMSLMKLFSRIIPPKDSSLPDHTLGLGSHAYAQFCMGLAAMIHDVDHTGFSNKQLVQAGTAKSVFYRNQSVAEQNSIDVAWRLLMSPDYQQLRHTIYTNEKEFGFFRKVIVHSVLATDILDPVLGSERASRWFEAFELNSETPTSDSVRNLQRTVVVESLMQAADILHTMQHWQIYVKWNGRLFRESYAAFKKSSDGSDTESPVSSWFENEQRFLESFVVPLAERLQKSGVFGLVSGREYLHHAGRNHSEWALNGTRIVEEWNHELKTK